MSSDCTLVGINPGYCSLVRVKLREGEGVIVKFSNSVRGELGCGC